MWPAGSPFVLCRRSLIGKCCLCEPSSGSVELFASRKKSWPVRTRVGRWRIFGSDVRRLDEKRGSSRLGPCFRRSLVLRCWRSASFGVCTVLRNRFGCSTVFQPACILLSTCSCCRCLPCICGLLRNRCFLFWVRLRSDWHAVACQCCSDLHTARGQFHASASSLDAHVDLWRDPVGEWSMHLDFN